jgi:hypothetical protein
MKYYIAENGQPAGPFEPNELFAHGLTVNSLVWCEGLPNWTSAGQVPELAALIAGQTYNPGGVDVQLPQVPPMGSQLPPVELPPFGGQPQPSQPSVPYGQGTTNQPYAPPQYGPSTQHNQPQSMPKNWFTECVLVTVLSALCCCNPVGLISGIYSIFKANSSKNKYMRGDVNGSAADGAVAKKWMIITIVIGLVWSCIQAYRIITNPAFLQQIQEGAVGSLYGF